MDTLDEIVPQARQPEVIDKLGGDQDDYDGYWHENRIDGEDEDSPESLAFADDEPAQDVGGEVGKKAPRWRPWQIALAIGGGMAVVAGITAAVYLHNRSHFR